jgi:hypothetical protein
MPLTCLRPKIPCVLCVLCVKENAASKPFIAASRFVGGVALNTEDTETVGVGDLALDFRIPEPSLSDSLFLGSEPSPFELHRADVAQR